MKVILTEGLDPAPYRWLDQQVEIIELSHEDRRFRATLAEADGLIVRTYTRVDESMLSGAAKLKVVGRAGVGLDNIDIPACRARGIEVVYTPDANTRAVAEYVFGLILQLVRPYAFFKDRVYDPVTFKRIREEHRGRHLNELTLGILGMGRIGRSVARIAVNGFGMKVIYNDIVDVSKLVEVDAHAVSFDELLNQSDILSLHVDMRRGNEKLIGEDAIKKMKPGSWLINTCRGEVLNALALANAIHSGMIAGTAIDVYDPEPPTADFPLLGLPNVLLSPHMAARTYSAIEHMSWVVRDVVAVLRGEKPKHIAP